MIPFRQAEIDLAQLEANLAVLRDGASGRLLADVGGDAWGHAIAVVVPALVELGVDAFAVGRLVEARAVREAAPGALVVLEQWAPHEVGAIAEFGFVPGIRDLAQLEAVTSAGTDTGWPLADDPQGMPGLDADGVAELRSRVAALDPAAFTRIGVDLLGLDGDDRLAPVLRVWAPVVTTKRVGDDEGVSYGYTYRTAGESTLALVSLGYADGLPRSASNVWRASLGGRTYTVAGRIAMDAFVLDLRDGEVPAVGAPVVALGDARRGEPTAAEQAAALGTVPEELTTRLAPRPTRVGVRPGVPS